MLALILIPVGVIIIIYARDIVDYIGEIEFAESVFLQGGTYTFVKLFGLAMTVFSFMWALGGLQPLLLSFFGPLFGV